LKEKADAVILHRKKMEKSVSLSKAGAVLQCQNGLPAIGFRPFVRPEKFLSGPFRVAQPTHHFSLSALKTLAQTRLPDGGQAWYARI